MLDPRWNPLNLLLLYHGVHSGLPVWATVAAHAALAFLVVAWPSRRPHLLRGLKNRWVVYGLTVATGIALVGWGMPKDVPSLTYLFYGADPEGISFPRWALAVIVWIGLATTVVLRWTDLIHTRIHLLLIRHGSVARLLRRELAKDLGTIVVAAALTATAVAVFDLVADRGFTLLIPEVVHHVVVGSMVTAFIVTMTLAVLWFTGSAASATGTLGVALVAALPLAPVFWPRPITTAFQAIRATTDGIHWAAILSAGATLLVSLALLWSATRVRPTNFN